MKNLIIFILICFIGLLLIFIIISKIGVSNTFKQYWDPIFTIFTAFLAIGITSIFWFSEKKYKKNELSSEVIDEYSNKDLYKAIICITDFVKDLECEIEEDDLNNKEIVKNKKMTIIEIYNELFINEDKGFKFKKRIYTWDELDSNRRLISLYYFKLNILREKNLINKKLLKKFWNPKSLSYLSNYVITLEFINPYVTRKLEPKYSMKETALINFYNFFIDSETKKYEIDKDDLEQIYKDFIKNNEKDITLNCIEKKIIKVKKILNN